ncbi:MAG: hypothetical protein ACTHLW_08375 [Verrucomicrobiota bacterium]
MKKLILCLSLSVFALGLHAGECKAAKNEKAVCTKGAASACCGKMSDSKASAPKTQSPKGAEQGK